MNLLQLNTEKNQYVDLLQTLSFSDKAEMYRKLKISLACDRMEELLSTVETGALSMAEITEVVEGVRQEMYEREQQHV